MHNKNIFILKTLILILLILQVLKKTQVFLLLNLEVIINIIFKLGLMKMKKMLIIFKCSINIKIKGREQLNKEDMIKIIEIKTRFSFIIILKMLLKTQPISWICKIFKIVTKRLKKRSLMNLDFWKIITKWTRVIEIVWDLFKLKKKQN